MLNLRRHEILGGEKLGEKLRLARESAGMTQEELARISGISRATISGLESGRVTVTKTDTLVALADALKKPVADIFF